MYPQMRIIPSFPKLSPPVTLICVCQYLQGQMHLIVKFLQGEKMGPFLLWWTTQLCWIISLGESLGPAGPPRGHICHDTEIRAEAPLLLEGKTLYVFLHCGSFHSLPFCPIGSALYPGDCVRSRKPVADTTMRQGRGLWNWASARRLDLPLGGKCSDPGDSASKAP